ncbi:MAG: epoxyqueuosine reductase QueH [bacterium]|nr:epoxyqueuosine reductase QueH [bacterium]
MDLKLPGKRLLLHACCCVCCGSIIEQLESAMIDYTLFFYNPNIQPEEEYEKRKTAVKNYCNRKRVLFVEGRYDIDKWINRTKSLTQEPERGKRCLVCFDMRLETTACYAYNNGYDVISTTLAISRQKNFEDVCLSGLNAAAAYPGLTFWRNNWRKKGGSIRMFQIAKKENFYKQNYCGCLYSKR